MDKIKYRVLHHTAVSRSNFLSQFRGVDNHHRKKFGGKSKLGYWVGYTGFIDVNGEFTQTRLIGEETFAVVGHNCNVPSTCDSVSFCVAFNGEKEVLNESQRKTLKKLYGGEIPLKKELAYSDFDITELENKFHRELQSQRICPGTLVTHKYIDDLLNDTDDTEDLRVRELEKQLKESRTLVGQLLAFIVSILSKY